MFLPENEHTFNVDIKGEKTNHLYEGKFVSKCILTIEEQVDVALRTDRYNMGSKSLSPAHALLNRTIAELEVRIKRDSKGKLLAPSWWVDSFEGRTLFDQNVVLEVFAKAVEGEKIWAEKVKGKADEAEKEVKDSEKIEKVVEAEKQ